jgi:hypothetical protein
LHIPNYSAANLGLNENISELQKKFRQKLAKIKGKLVDTSTSLNEI